jgi:hypothetical protein
VSGFSVWQRPHFAIWFDPLYHCTAWGTDSGDSIL